MIVNFPADRLFRVLCGARGKPKKAGDPDSAPRVTKPVYVGEVEVTRLTFESPAQIGLPPGHYWLHSTGKRDFQADLTAGGNHYLRIRRNALGKGDLDFVRASEAEQETAAATREMTVRAAGDDPHPREMR